MVRTYKRKTEQHSWSIEAMRQPVHSVVSGEMGCKKAVDMYNVPKTTLERYISKYRSNPDDSVFQKKLGHFRSVFSPDQEIALINNIKLMEVRFHRLTSRDLRKIAFVMAQKNGIPHKFDSESGLAGKDWLNGFLKRHPDISYRKTEPTSTARSILTSNKTLTSQIPKWDKNIRIPPRELTPQPGCSWMVDRPPSLDAKGLIMPVLMENKTSQGVGEQRGRTAIITESPNKGLLEVEKTSDQEKKVTKKLKLECVKQKSIKAEEKKGSSGEDDDAECIYCGSFWSESSEEWIRCLKCPRWAHFSCAGEDEKDLEAIHIVQRALKTDFVKC